MTSDVIGFLTDPATGVMWLAVTAGILWSRGARFSVRHIDRHSHCATANEMAAHPHPHSRDAGPHRRAARRGDTVVTLGSLNLAYTIRATGRINWLRMSRVASEIVGVMAAALVAFWAWIS